MGLSIFDEVSPYTPVDSMDETYGTFPENITSQELVPRRLDAVLVSSTDTIDHVLTVYYVSQGSPYLLGAVTIPAAAGSVGVRAVEILSAILPADVDGIVLWPLGGLSVVLDATLTTGTVMQFVGQGGYL